MKGMIGIVALALTAGSATASWAETADYKAESPVVVERAPSGKALVVRVEGRDYPVCQNERQDSCIQPRAAGLGWGDRPLAYWPGNNTGKGG